MRRFIEFIVAGNNTPQPTKSINEPEHTFIALDSIVAVYEIPNSDKIRLDLGYGATLTVIGDYEEVKSWLLEENDRLV